MDSEAEAGEPDLPTATPPRPVRSARAKGAGGDFKSVNYHFDTHSSSDDSSQEDDDDDVEDAQEEPGALETEENDQSSASHVVGSSNPSADADAATVVTEDHDMQQDDPPASPTRTGTRRSYPGRGRKGAESDDIESTDSEFEPPKKVSNKGRGRAPTKKQASPTPDTTAKKTSRSSKPKPKETAGQSSSVKVDAKRKNALAEETPLSPESLVDTPTSTASTASAPASSNSRTPVGTILAALTPVLTPSLTPGSTSTATAGEQDAIQKVKKKKRRLLTGKGLDELGDILNGPGMTAMASPSKSLQFLPSKARFPGGRSTTLLGGDKPAAPKEALDAIKMAFTLPKVRNHSPNPDGK